MESQTLRRHIIALLRGQERDARDLSQALGLKEKEIYEHLVHVERLVVSSGGKFIITPCQCLLCGFVFETRRRLTRPSHCPACFRAKLPDGFDLPKPLARLSELAYNLWWTWQPEAARLFRRLDFDLWERLGHNPIMMLREVGRPRLNQVAKDKEYLAAYDQVFAEFDAYMEQTDTWTTQSS